jgi:acetyl esterase/lipase
MGEGLASALKAANVETTFILFPGEKHGGFKDKSALSKTKEFFNKVLKEK